MIEQRAVLWAPARACSTSSEFASAIDQRGAIGGSHESFFGAVGNNQESGESNQGMRKRASDHRTSRGGRGLRAGRFVGDEITVGRQLLAPQVYVIRWQHVVQQLGYCQRLFHAHVQLKPQRRRVAGVDPVGDFALQKTGRALAIRADTASAFLRLPMIETCTLACRISGDTSTYVTVTSCTRGSRRSVRMAMLTTSRIASAAF